MKKASNISAIICFVMIILSYIVFSLNLEMTGKKLNILYALTGHIAWVMIALIFFFESNNHVVRFLSIYTAIFFFLAISLFIYVGIIENQSYFRYKLCIYLSIILTFIYETVSFIRKYKIHHRNDFGSSGYFIFFCRRFFLPKDKRV